MVYLLFDCDERNIYKLEDGNEREQLTFHQAHIVGSYPGSDDKSTFSSNRWGNTISMS
jgi:hypothetical protein